MDITICDIQFWAEKSKNEVAGQVRRNLKRFPEEFMFKLNKKEKDELVTNWHRFEKLKS